MIVDEDKAPAKYDYKGNVHYFCSVACREAFSKDPGKFLERRGEDLEETGIQHRRLMGLGPYLTGVAAAMGVVGFYLGLLTVTSDWYNARSQFGEYGIWILALGVGLGVQATLFSLYRAWHRGESMKAAKYSLAASGGISTTAMAACCAHYLVVILPVLGLPFLSAAAAGLAGYQTYFFLAGVISNLFGIGLMIRMMSRSGMIQLRGFIGIMKEV
jgi:YHS domain-containing protein